MTQNRLHETFWHALTLPTLCGLAFTHVCQARTRACFNVCVRDCGFLTRTWIRTNKTTGPDKRVDPHWLADNCQQINVVVCVQDTPLGPFKNMILFHNLFASDSSVSPRWRATSTSIITVDQWRKEIAFGCVWHLGNVCTMILRRRNTTHHYMFFLWNSFRYAHKKIRINAKVCSVNGYITLHSPCMRIIPVFFQLHLFEIKREMYVRSKCESTNCNTLFTYFHIFIDRAVNVWSCYYGVRLWCDVAGVWCVCVVFLVLARERMNVYVHYFREIWARTRSS